MKRSKKKSLMACLAVILCLLLFPFSGISIAKQTVRQKCVSACNYQQKKCLDANTDKEACEKDYQQCVSGCKSKGASSSPALPEQRKLKPSETTL